MENTALGWVCLRCSATDREDHRAAAGEELYIKLELNVGGEVRSRAF